MTDYLPNSTQVPNLLFNGKMHEMNDTELRVVLIVTRKTLGWLQDPETGMRKEEDWISRGQLIKLTGRGKNAVSKAINNCTNQGWIEARSEEGNLLDTPKKRQQIGRGGKIFYRLGAVFMGKAKRLKGSRKDTLFNEKEKGSLKRKPLKGNLKEDTTKETVIQNKPFNKTVNGNKNLFKKLPNLEIPKAQIEYIKDEILSFLKDKHSVKFYWLVASKIPESVIRQAIAEIKVDGADNPARVFTYRMRKYALAHQDGG